MRTHWAVAALCGVMLVGCAEVWDALAEAVRRANGAGEVKTEDIAVLASSASELGRFETAAGALGLEDPAAQHVGKLGREVVAVLGDGSLTAERRLERFRRLLGDNLDIPVIARFALGRYWTAASDEQRRSYLRAFTAFVVGTYAARLGGVEVDRMDILGSDAVGSRDVVVHSQIALATKKPLRADWRVRESGGSYRILDLSVEGISMALTLRQEFASVLGRQGGVEGLIALLKQRTV